MTTTSFDFKRELANIRLPKVLCNPCSTRLGDFERGITDYGIWAREKRQCYDSLARDYDVVETRTSVVCAEGNRCKICCIASKCLSNEKEKFKSDTPKPGRPAKHSPIKKICTRCGLPENEHNDKLCKLALKRPHAAGKIFAERAKARKYVDKMKPVALILRLFLGSNEWSFLVLPGVSLGSNEFLALCPVSYRPRLKSTELSREGARDLLRLGHLGLGQKSARELCKVLRREGIQFPKGGLRNAWEERWEIFGHLFRPEKLLLQSDTQADPISTPFGICNDVEALFGVVTGNEANRVTRLKLQFDGGQQFLKVSVNIVTMEEGSKYIPAPNSVLKNFVIGMGEGAETRHNLEQIFGCDSINEISSHTRVWDRRNTAGDGVDPDLKDGAHSVVAQPVIQWDKSPLELLTLPPLHLMFGIVNKLYSLARPSDECTSKGSLYTRHCKALADNNIGRSAYFEGALEGNSCSRLLDVIADDKIPFSPKATLLVNALKAFHEFKEKCLGLYRVDGWERSIERFGSAWDATSLVRTLKVHVVLHHVKEYLLNYESVPEAGLGLSSEQSGEALHARLQRIWNLRFKYNWNLRWDEAERAKEREIGKVETDRSESDTSISILASECDSTSGACDVR
ncbi:hypothetical protein FOL47_004560 [Perkinsus chesapeaki]|uniref:Uncharacterized protein n=1 Tax=Perkinsus chesapeaki TaxID=330153 RepID=A0A7J6MZT1_PERCH|nr:hypothetical protein FOL47_004560 [Perkinsus chesapeaki]